MVPKFLKDIHWPIVLVTGVLTVIGILAIYSASFRTGGEYAGKQLIWWMLSTAIFLAVIRIGYRPFLNVAYPLYGSSIILLAAVFVIGETRSGANRWIALGPFLLQPSELCKIATILMLANFLAGRSIFSKQKRSLVISMILVGLPVVLILKQPDLGSALVFVPVLIAMLFFWGVRVRYLAALFGAGLIALPFVWNALAPYQKKRLLVFLNPSIDPIGASYTAIQSKIAVGSGGLFGKGWLHGTQTQLDFVPEHHTDFIFTVIAEEFGFLGTLLVIFLFAVLLGYIFRMIQQTTDLKARLLGLGIAVFFFFQIFVNIGMTIGLAPITGITLPFMSYGGSSLAVNFLALGLLISIYKERSIF